MEMPENPMKGQMVIYEGKAYKFRGGNKEDNANWEPVPYGPKTMGESMGEELEGKPMGTRLLAGGLGAFDKAAYGVKGLLTDLAPEEQQRVDAAKGTTGTTAGKVGSFGTNLALSYPLFTKGVPQVASAAKSPLGRDLLSILGAGGIGAGYGAATNPGERLKGALTEGLGAATGQSVGMLAKGPLSPVSGSAADALQKEGVPITIGQSGGFQGLEDSMRGSSRSVGKRQAEAIQAWSQNEVNKTMPADATSVSGRPIPFNVSGKGRDAISEGSDNFNTAYDRAYGKVGDVQADAPLQAGIQQVVSRTSPLLIKSDAELLAEHARRGMAEFQSGELKGRAVKDLVKSFDDPAQAAYDAGNKRLGDAYRSIQEQIKGAVARQFPDGAVEISKIDPKYAEFLRVQRAAGKPGAADGVFSPDQLMQSIRDLDKSPDKRAFARGNTVPNLLNQAEIARDVLGPRIPPVGPGTAEKTIPAMVAQNWMAAIPGMASFGLYRPSVQNMLTGRQGWQQGIDPEWMAAVTGALANR
jgi:hypothetical protein